MEEWAIFRPVDWLSLWKIYESLFIVTYIVSGIPLRIWMSRHANLPSPNKAWTISWTLASLFIFCVPFTSLPAFFLVFLVAGRTAAQSFFMALPIAASVGLAGSLVDTLLYRFLLCEKVNKSRFRLLFVGNAVNVALAIGVVLEWLFVFPPRIIAMLSC